MLRFLPMRSWVRTFTITACLVAVSAGCAAPPSPTATPAIPTLEPEPSPSTVAAVPHPSWKELRDGRTGYGIGIPCWWIVMPTPELGLIATMTIQSFDEAYFLAHSTRGVWNGDEYPEGAIKMDWGLVTEVDPALSTPDALHDMLENDVQEIVSTEEVQVGGSPAVFYQLRSRLHPEETSRLHAFRLGPDQVLMVSAYPDRALETPDVQGILSSLALTADAPVNLPTFAPSQPLIEVPAGCTPP